MALSLLSASAVVAVALAGLAALSCVLLWVNERHLLRGTRPRFWPATVYLRDMRRTDGRHTLGLGSYLEIGGSLLLLAVPARVTLDLPVEVRLVMLAAGVGFFMSAALGIFNDHTWYNPDETSRPGWHEAVRVLAGPIVTALVAVIALPADWTERGWLAAVVITLLPLTLVFRISDTDLIVRYLVPLVREEAHAGRELVLSETHGALSTHLRLLEQQARAVRDAAPALYELAVSAHSRLRETLTLSQLDTDSATGVGNLGAGVLTLARAVGARADVEIAVEDLGAGDRDVARLVLNDLVGNALNAGAAGVAVRLDADGSEVVASVRDDAPAMAAGVWKSRGTSSARLETRLAGLGGSLRCTPEAGGKTVTARWTAGRPAAGAAGVEGDDAGSAG